MSPSGAVCAGPPAAQAEQMERLSVHDFASVPPADDGGESRGTRPSGAVRAGPPAAQAEQMERFRVHEYSTDWKGRINL